MNTDYQNPFDNKNYQFLVLINQKKQYSIWPDFSPIPAGWEKSFGPSEHEKCLSYIEKNWLDIRLD